MTAKTATKSDSKGSKTASKKKPEQQTITIKLSVEEAADLAHAARAGYHPGARPLYETEVHDAIVRIEEAVAEAEGA